MQPRQPDVTPAPSAVLRNWPLHRPVAVRWNAAPDSGGRVVIGAPSASRTARSATELESLLRDLQPAPRSPTASISSSAGWFGWISYDAGRVFEPATVTARSRAIADRDWPLASFQRIESSIEFDLAAGNRIGLGSDPEIPDHLLDLNGAAIGYRVDPIDTEANRANYFAGVDRIIEYIRAGDVYQVNLAHRLSAAFTGSARHFFADLAERARPWHGGYFEGDGYAIASLSPELFLEADFETGAVRTRPMKGTRAYAPGTDAAARAELDSSAKDRAELAMIVDLMRNDLGRVCELGSVRVEQERRIERHQSGVLQATATIAGKLRPGASLADILRATFPPGSVTGAPKIRAMQIIDELEPAQRGPYCGTMLWLGDDGRLSASVMIRTLCLEADRLDYWVGAGIVADSDPAAEWLETLAKAAVLVRADRKEDRNVEVVAKATKASANTI
ncbi:MAG: anthranilate synthase component I family protein [Phycisphaeraceae bacterium]|nr:anthranilate synthase component I family protein [Phycisphaeraceae bacterium]